MNFFSRHSFVFCILAKSLIISFQYNIESVYFFYSNPVQLSHVNMRISILQNLVELESIRLDGSQSA
jgi:hypothetical protein